MGSERSHIMKGSIRLLSMLGLFAALLAAGCTGSDVITAGSTHITKKDLEYRQKIAEIYSPQNENNRLVAAVQLINGALGMEMMKSFGYKFDNAELESEAKRIDDTSKAPEKLQKIKEVFGSDRAAYLKDFVSVVYAERSLYNDVYLKKDEIHKAQMTKTVDFLKEAEKDIPKFKEIAAKNGFNYIKLKLSAKKGITLLELEKRQSPPPDDVEGAKKMIDSIKDVKKGEISKNIVDWPFAYQVIRLIEKKGDDYFVECAIAKKKTFLEWFWESAGKVPVTIRDKALKDELSAKVEWMKKVNVQ